MSGINLQDVETGAEPSTGILGADPFDNAGRSIDFVGDLIGDGTEEILIGAPNAEQTGGGQDAGAAYLVFGAADPGGGLATNGVARRKRRPCFAFRRQWRSHPRQHARSRPMKACGKASRGGSNAR